MIENNAYPLNPLSSNGKELKKKFPNPIQGEKAEKMFEIWGSKKHGGKNKRRQLTQSSHYTPKPLLIC